MSEVLRDLVVSLSLDGDNFSRNLTSINKQIQEAESEFRRAASGVDNFEKSVSGTQSQLSSLQQKLALQQKTVQQYEKALTAANKKLENAYTRQGRLTEALDAARQKNADLKQQVAAATKQYERFARELGESDSATLAAKANLDALSQEYADSSAEVKKLEGQLAANTKSLQNNADAVTKARTNLNNAQGALRQTKQQIRTTTERLARMQSAWTKAGILAGRSGVISAMRSAARDAVNAAKRELKIKSPSGVFRDEVGRMAMRGFGQGALMESKNQVKVIQNAARYLTGAAQSGVGGTNSYDNRKTYNQNASTTIQVDKLVVRDEQDVRSLAIEIAGLTRRQQRGKGMRFA